MGQVIEREEQHISTADFVATRGAQAEGPQPLLPQDFSNDLRSKWDRIQTGFVDEPRAAVKEADELVATAMKRIAESFAEERNRLEQEWDRGSDVSTEDLRIALQRYRSFFQRLLNI
jgi:hypothetical protein